MMQNLTTIINSTILHPTAAVLKNQTYQLPSSFTTITSTSYNVIIVYCILFLIGASGNISVFLSVTRRQLKSRLKWRIIILIIHLSLADLIVICIVIPSEVIWRSTIAWYGGNLICKLCQFGRAFGLYLSSMILICISIDRFYAIVFPLRMVNASSRVKGMLSGAWILAGLCAFPQAIVFNVQRHPKYPSFKQCVSYGFLNTDQLEMIYNVFSVSIMYFLPLVVIILTYSMILWKIIKKSKEHARQSCESRRETMNNTNGSVGIIENPKNSLLVSTTSSTNHHPLTTVTTMACTNRNTSTNTFSLELSSNGAVGNSESRQFRGNNSTTTTNINNNNNNNTRGSNEAAVAMMAKAKWKILRLTCIIICLFILCWTPYVVMLLWYIFDRESARNVSPGIQDGLFMMAVANSVVNPFVYGNYTREPKKSSSTTCCIPCCDRPLLLRRSSSRIRVGGGFDDDAAAAANNYSNSLCGIICVKSFYCDEFEACCLKCLKCCGLLDCCCCSRKHSSKYSDESCSSKSSLKIGGGKNGQPAISNLPNNSTHQMTTSKSSRSKNQSFPVTSAI